MKSLLLIIALLVTPIAPALADGLPPPKDWSQNDAYNFVEQCVWAGGQAARDARGHVIDGSAYAPLTDCYAALNAIAQASKPAFLAHLKSKMLEANHNNQLEALGKYLALYSALANDDKSALLAIQMEHQRQLDKLNSDSGSTSSKADKTHRYSTDSDKSRTSKSDGDLGSLNEPAGDNGSTTSTPSSEDTFTGTVLVDNQSTPNHPATSSSTHSQSAGLSSSSPSSNPNGGKSGQNTGAYSSRSVGLSSSSPSSNTNGGASGQNTGAYTSPASTCLTPSLRNLDPNANPSTDNRALGSAATPPSTVSESGPLDNDINWGDVISPSPPTGSTAMQHGSVQTTVHAPPPLKQSGAMDNDLNWGDMGTPAQPPASTARNSEQ